MERIGNRIVGARFAADLHAHALSKIRGSKCDIVAVCSRTKESAEVFAKKFNIPHVYTDHRAMLARKDIQLVTLPVVTSLHHTLAIDAAVPGSTSSSKKPLTGCFADADAMPRHAMFAEAMKNADAVAEACRRKPGDDGVCGEFRVRPAVAKLRRLMDASRRDVARPAGRGEPLRLPRRVLAPLAHAGGGSMLRMGSHPIGAVIHLKHYEGMKEPAAHPGEIRPGDVAQLSKHLRSRPRRRSTW